MSARYALLASVSVGSWTLLSGAVAVSGYVQAFQLACGDYTAGVRLLILTMMPSYYSSFALQHGVIRSECYRTVALLE